MEATPLAEASSSFSIIGQTYSFKEISPTQVPLPTFPNRQSPSVKEVGLSPRSMERLRIGIFLLLPNTPLACQFVDWHPLPNNFCFHIMDYAQWQRVTGASPRMLHVALTTTGKPPLFWRFQFTLCAFPEPNSDTEHGPQVPPWVGDELGYDDCVLDLDHSNLDMMEAASNDQQGESHNQEGLSEHDLASFQNGDDVSPAF